MPSNSRFHSIALVSAAVVVPALVHAQGKGASVHTTPPPVAAAAPRTGPIHIDGLLNDSAWAAATPISEFRQIQPNEGSAASLPMQVRVLYDDDALYIGARMQGPAKIAAPLARRDQLLDANGNNGSFNSLTTDKFVVDLDPYHNHLDDVLFEVNPAGVKGEQFNGDPSWDPIWEAAAHIDSTGWTAEMRIPFSQLRFSKDTAQTWGLQIWRYVDQSNERDMWAFWGRSQPGGPAFYGHLTGLVIRDRPRQLELLPYIVTGSTFHQVPTADPYHSNPQQRVSAGGDIKYLLTSNLTLDATINPDFGQVEVDPAVLNLSAFETYYEEKRPFFISGASAFYFGGMNCYFCSNTSSLDAFYSRRIGRPPQLDPYVTDISTYADVPDNTSILGAAKITGRTNRGYNIGVLDAVTQRETAHYLSTSTAPESSLVVEPLTNYFVGRTNKEFREGATTFGGIVTSVARSMDDTVMSNRLRDHAEEAGFDWRHRWHGRRYSWMGSALFTNVGGSPEAIAATQESSAHYFQRPDRRVEDGVFTNAYDPTRTSLNGYGWYSRVAKDNGTLLWELMGNVRSPGFESNDISFLDRSDLKWVNGNVVGNWTTPTNWYRTIFASAGGATEYNYDGDRTSAEYQTFVGWQLPNYWNVRTFYIRDVPSYDPLATRGGPVVKRDGYNFVSGEISTDARRPAVFDFTAQGYRLVGDPGYMIRLTPGMALKPAANVFVQLSPRYQHSRDPGQYVDAFDDPTATAFYGKRYVFGEIDTKQVSLDTRVNWTFLPTLTLQLFAQPFIASGNYLSFREYAGTRTLTKLAYGKDVGTISYDDAASTYTVDPDGAGPAGTFSFANPNFTVRALRGTSVLRWE
ncbi:MAG TPA: DUF5916 domain-containing protein, partial [Gemmatimonadaceae bacterium]|nr:DUF5916 domain-containing protein [Gemmatimonadaceae bacterium]